MSDRNQALVERINTTRQNAIMKELMDKDTTVMIEDPLENEMVLNMGPQHPATHGVLRVLLRLDGETVVKCIPELGYLHRGYEKLAENVTYHEFIPHTDRLDYLAPMSNNVAIALAIENAIGIEAPPRAQWIRMLVAEMARISSHLLAAGATSMDVGALTMFLWTFTEREKMYDLFELISGARFTTSYTRIGGVAQDISDEVLHKIRMFINQLPDRQREFEGLVMRNRIFIDRMAGVGHMPLEKAISLGLTGPTLRGSGSTRDLRKDAPYLFYDQVEFDVISHTDGDVWARFQCRMQEISESIKIIHQILDKMPPGPIRLEDHQQTLPRKGSIYTKMEELISDFMVVNFGSMPPIGETYTAIESPKGELGFFIVSDGTGYPWKLKIRSPSAANLQALKFMTEGSMISDVVAIIGSIDPVMGEADK
ncbi:MAG TPA: NADH dehydrogenase (quinone) subunit D [Patescibacteria group bacterium]|nr:NADH dehydrogenase (quinone) subunit D [Patescibacteria group bacterium]